MSHRIHTKTISALLAISLLIPAGLLTAPQRAEAQGASCAGVVAGAVASAIGISAATKIIGVTTSSPGGEAAGIVSAGSGYGSFFQDCILKPIAIKMARTMVRNISNSIVNWINNDFKGKPGFVTDINGLIADSADEVIGGFIYGSDLNFLCQPFSFRIRLALATKYTQSFREQVSCTLSDVVGNINNFANNNGGAGWNNWLQITTQPQNNVYGAYLMADSQLAQNVQGQLDKLNNMLNRNGGFLDFQVCEAWDDPLSSQGIIAANQAQETPGQVTFTSGSFNSSFGSTQTSLLGNTGGSVTGLGSNLQAFEAPQAPITANNLPTFSDTTGDTFGMQKTCKKWKTTTPGSLVQEQANKVLGGWADQLNLATEIDQIIGALISHFADKIASPGGSGFLGLSSADGYANTSSTNFSNVLASADNLSNPENAGLGAATQAADVNMAEIFPITNIDTGGNIASGRNVSASDAGDSDPAFATDGDPTTAAATGAVANPWLEIDLGKATSIAEVHVWNVVGESAEENLGDFRVIISNTKNGADWSSSGIAASDSSPNPIVVSVNGSGRYVRVERSDNSYQCEDIETYTATCHHPLRVGEIEVVEIPTVSGSPSEGTNAGNTAQISIGPATGRLAITNRSPLLISVPVNSTETTSIRSLEVRLYSQDSLISWNTLASDAAVGLSQNGVTKNFYPGASTGIDFSYVLAGGSYGTAIVLRANTFSGAATGPYRLVITAKDQDQEVIDSETVNFVVQ